MPPRLKPPREQNPRRRIRAQSSPITPAPRSAPSPFAGFTLIGLARALNMWDWDSSFSSTPSPGHHQLGRYKRHSYGCTCTQLWYGTDGRDTLDSSGCEPETLLCGGPLTTLRAFTDYHHNTTGMSRCVSFMRRALEVGVFPLKRNRCVLKTGTFSCGLFEVNGQFSTSQRICLLSLKDAGDLP